MNLFSRREFIARSAGFGTLAAAGAVAGAFRAVGAPLTQSSGNPAGGGRPKQSVCRWPYPRVSLTDFCRRTKQMGFAGIELLFPDEWAEAAGAGLVVSMGYASRRDKFLRTGFHGSPNQP